MHDKVNSKCCEGVCAALTCGAVCAVEQVYAEFELVQRVYLL